MPVGSHIKANSGFRFLIEGLAAVVGNWIYIDGGELSYMSNGNVTYQYCMFWMLLSYAVYLSRHF